MPQKTIDLLLDEMHISLQELAQRTGISNQRLLSITSGRWTPSPEDRAKIAAALEVSTDQISWGHSMNSRNVRYHQHGLKEDF